MTCCGDCSGSLDAPSATNSGEKCSMVGWAYGMPGAWWRKSMSASTSPAVKRARAHASNSVDQQQTLRIQRGHRDLQHRDGGVGIHDGQRHIGAVVKPAV